MQPNQNPTWDEYLKALGVRGVRSAHVIYDDLGFDPPLAPVTEAELDYVYESLGVRRKPPLPCKHPHTEPVLRNSKIRQCVDCNRVLAEVPTRKGRR